MRRIRWLVSLVGLLLLATVGAGCSDGERPTMMGQRSGFEGPGSSPFPRGYHRSRLTCSARASLPGRVVHVMLGDRGMSRMMNGIAPRRSPMMLRAAPASVPAGQVSFVVGNMGWRTHEMVVLPLSPGQAAGTRVPGADGKIDESAGVGEASTSCGAGSGEGIEAGTVGWLTLDLAPGRYELVCNLRNHYANGMHQLFVVAG